MGSEEVFRRNWIGILTVTVDRKWSGRLELVVSSIIFRIMNMAATKELTGTTAASSFRNASTQSVQA